MSGISTRLNEADLFSQEIGFDQAQMPAGMLPQYSGKISCIADSLLNDGILSSFRARFFGYDYAERLSTERTNGTAVNYSYDPRGNILSESGPDRGASYTYDGEKLIYVNISGDNQQSCSFAHDALGRMVYNGMTGQQIAYNDLDLVRNIESNGTTLVNYFYLADGTKFSALDDEGSGLELYSVKGILKSEALDIADNVHTLFDSDASGFEKGIAAFDLVTGFGDQAKWLAKTVGVSDGIVDGAKATDAVKNRVKLRKSTRTTIIEQAPKNADGDFIDPNTGMIVPK